MTKKDLEYFKIKLEKEKKLLEEEGVEVSEDFMIDLKKYGWWGSDEENLDSGKLEEQLRAF